MITPVLALVAMVVASPASAASTRPWNLYEWMAVAPSVVVGDVRVRDSRLVEVHVDLVVRGTIAAGNVVLVDQGRANRRRPDGTPRLVLEEGHSYVLLLEPKSERSPGGDPILDLVRGPAGARALGEGGELLVDAVTRLAAWQDRRDESMLWIDLARSLDDANALLVETALDLFAKFRRAHAGLLPSLSRLLNGPRPDFREKAAALAGQALARAEETPAAREVVAALISLARRDPAVEVRVAATRALGDIKSGTPFEVLREIARTDPDQGVRYEAERLVLTAGRPVD